MSSPSTCPGYGRSDKPDVRYDMEWVNACLAGVITGLGHERAVMVGHDWGGLLVWPFARRYPELTAGVIGVEHTRPAAARRSRSSRCCATSSRTTRRTSCSSRSPGVAEWVLSLGSGRGRLPRDDAAGAGHGATRRSFTDEVIAVYADALSPRGAFTPPIEYYRNLDRSWHLTADLADQTIDVPCLMISADDDPVLSPAMAEGMEERVPDLEKVVIPDCGHFTQQERPAETTRRCSATSAGSSPGPEAARPASRTSRPASPTAPSPRPPLRVRALRLRGGTRRPRSGTRRRDAGSPTPT